MGAIHESLRPLTYEPEVPFAVTINAHQSVFVLVQRMIRAEDHGGRVHPGMIGGATVLT